MALQDCGSPSPRDKEDPMTDKKLKLFAMGEVPEEEVLSHQASVMSGGKKKNVKEQIVISMTEIHELIAFLDYSFERAFKVKENGYIGAY